MSNTKKGDYENRLDQTKHMHRESLRLRELISRLPEKCSYPFNKNVISVGEVRHFGGFDNFGYNEVCALLTCAGGKKIPQLWDDNLQYEFGLNHHTFFSIRYHSWRDLNQVLKEFFRTTPVTAEEKKAKELKKLSREEREEFISFMRNPSGFWLHPGRWADDDSKTPIWLKSLPSPEDIELGRVALDQLEKLLVD